MKTTARWFLFCLVLHGLGQLTSAGQSEPVRDVSFFLRRLRSVDHLPELEQSHTATSSTWDRSGGNEDGFDFKQITQDGRNVLLDVDGPGCIHRIFACNMDHATKRRFTQKEADTRIQIFLDGNSKAVIDLTLAEFFNARNGPFPYPLIFWKTYPGCLAPIPFAKHCRVQLVNPRYGKPGWINHHWAGWWQITYTRYPQQTKVASLRMPLTEEETHEVSTTCRSWLEAESSPPAEPAAWTVAKVISLEPGKATQIAVPGCGVIRQMRVAVRPATPEVLRKLRLRMTWDGAKSPSVDVPLGYFFGHADCGHSQQLSSVNIVMGKDPPPPHGQIYEYSSNYNSLVMGVTDTEAYTRFPMPFAKGAVFTLENRSAVMIEKLQLRLELEKRESLPQRWGRFHTTWTEERAAGPNAPKFGAKKVPGKVVLDRRGRGKYVGALLHVAWPHADWWGEGDWLIWTDEVDWPPSYHGTGSEEYFNSGYGGFDRKAVSGFVTVRPGHATVYSFHLNDAFQFHKNIRVVEEQMGHQAGADLLRRTRPIWGSPAYWYAPLAQPAGSTRSLLERPTP